MLIWRARLARATLKNYAAAFRSLVAQIGAASNRPYLHQAVPIIDRGSPRKVIATPEELTALLAAAPTWLRAIILLAAHAGFRRSDCLRIAPIHYSQEQKTITITQQKTNHTVCVPASGELQLLFAAAPDGDPATPLYALHRGQTIGTTGLGKAWCRAKKKAGVNPGLWLHDLRRTLAVSLYELTKDLRVVEQFLGHRSLNATVMYLEHRDANKLRPYLDALFIPKTQRVQ